MTFQISHVGSGGVQPVQLICLVSGSPRGRKAAAAATAGGFQELRDASSWLISAFPYEPWLFPLPF